VVAWRYHYHHHHTHIPFFPFLLRSFLRLLLFGFFLFIANIITATQWCIVNVYIYIHIHTHICKRMYSFCATICHSGIHVMYSSEEVILLCVQSNNFLFFFFIFNHQMCIEWKSRKTKECGQ
jgi:hypothetical protein